MTFKFQCMYAEKEEEKKKFPTTRNLILVGLVYFVRIHLFFPSLSPRAIVNHLKGKWES